MAASGRRRLQSDPKTPPPNRLPPIHPRPRGTGTLGAPTSSSAHGSPPPDRLRCLLLDGRTRSLISASEDKRAASQFLQVRILVSPAGGGGREAAGSGQVWAVNGCPRPQKMRTWTTWTGVDHVGCVAALRKSVPVVPIRITGQRPCAAKISPRGTAPRCRNLVGAGQPSVLCPLIGDEILRTGAAVASSKPCLVIEPR